MKETGIVRRIDDLGRVVIPKSVRPGMGIEAGDPLELYTVGDCVILRKYREDQKPPLFEELEEAHMLAHRRGEALGAANTRIDELEDVITDKNAEVQSLKADKVRLQELRDEIYALACAKTAEVECLRAALSHKTDQPTGSIEARHEYLQRKHTSVMRLLFEVCDVIGVESNPGKAWRMILEWVRDNAPEQPVAQPAPKGEDGNA